MGARQSKGKGPPAAAAAAQPDVAAVEAADKRKHVILLGRSLAGKSSCFKHIVSEPVVAVDIDVLRAQLSSLWLALARHECRVDGKDDEPVLRNVADEPDAAKSDINRLWERFGPSWPTPLSANDECQGPFKPSDHEGLEPGVWDVAPFLVNAAHNIVDDKVEQSKVSSVAMRAKTPLIVQGSAESNGVQLVVYDTAGERRNQASVQVYKAVLWYLFVRDSFPYAAIIIVTHSDKSGPP